MKDCASRESIPNKIKPIKMKIMRKSFFIRLCIIIATVLHACPIVHAEIYSGNVGDVVWEVNTGTGVLTLSGDGTIRSLGNSRPWYSYIASIREIVVGSGVAFPSSFTTDKCTNVTTVTINSNAVMASDAKSMESMGSVFGPQVTKYVIGEGVKKIGLGKFNGSTALQEVHLPTSLDSVSTAFAYCDNLRAIHIKDLDSFLRIGYEIRYKDAADELFPERGWTPVGMNNPVSATYNQIWPEQGGVGGGRHLYLNGVEVTRISVPDGITSIAPYQFQNWPSLRSVTLPASVREIGEGAFSGCLNLISVNIPEGVSVIEPYTFQRTGLKSLTLPSTLKRIRGKAFVDLSIESLVVPEGVESIGRCAFEESPIMSISLPSTLCVIEAQAFKDCRILVNADFASIQSLCNIEFKDEYANPIRYSHTLCVQGSKVRDVVVPEGVTRIPSYAFQQADIAAVQLPRGLREIGDYAFSGSKLPTINIPQSVQNIGTCAFRGSELKTIDFTGYNGNIGLCAFNECQQLERVTLPSENPLCYTSDDGKLIFMRDSTKCMIHDGEYDYKDTLVCEPMLVSVLPTVTELSIPYPVTGAIATYYKDDLYEYPIRSVNFRTSALQGIFKSLRRLELPCTWKVAVGREVSDALYMPRLEEVVLRSPKPTPFGRNVFWKQVDGGRNPITIYDENGRIIDFNTEAPDIYVFDYAEVNFEEAAKSSIFRWEAVPYLYYEDHALYGVQFKTLSLPSENTYLQEALPAYRTAQTIERQRDEEDYYLWNSDWENALMADLPDYFTSNVVEKTGYVPTDYRFSIVQRYLTEEKQYAMPDSVVQCIDGNIHLSHEFNTNDYLNWYLTPDIVTADYATTDKGGVSTVMADPTWNLPNGTYFYVMPSSPTGNSILTFDVRMLPGFKYNIYLLVAPHFSYDGLVYDDSKKGKVKPSLTWADGTGYKTVTGTTQEISYSGVLGKVLLFSEVEVEKDHINRVKIQTSVTNIDLKKGYTNQMAILGVLVDPLNTPDAIADTVTATMPCSTAIYDLQGRRVTSPMKGLYIEGGKKVFVP